MKFRMVLEYDPDTQAFSAVCPELPGCASAGDTEELYRAPSEVGLLREAKLTVW
jgi:predicted RNase H-like HicB family nuclease